MHRRGFELPNHTQTPNTFLDESLKKITSLCELKIMLAIIRKTFGWHKQQERISLSELERLTGLSREGVKQGVRLALAHGFIEREAIGQGYSYGLVLGNNLTPPRKTTRPQFDPALGNNLTQQLGNNLTPPIDKEIRKETIKRKEHSARDFIGELKADPFYAHVDFNVELEAMRRWLARPANKGRRLTERFVMNWINKIDRPITIPASNGRVKKVESAEQKQFREACLRCFGTGTETVPGKGARLCNHERT